jgi:hypothetical protein
MRGPGPTGPAAPEPARAKPAQPSTNERLVIYVPKELDRQLRMHAAGQRKSLSEVAVEAIGAFLALKP